MLSWTKLLFGACAHCLHPDFECGSQPRAGMELTAPGRVAGEDLGSMGGSSDTHMQPVSIPYCPWARRHLQSSPGHPSSRFVSPLTSMAVQLSLRWQRLITKPYEVIYFFFKKKRSRKDMGTKSPTLFIFVSPWLCACQRAISLLPGWNRNSVMHTWGVLSLQ